MKQTEPHATVIAAATFHRRALTLVDLCTVIAILTVLFALLVPVVRNVREQATRVKCASNLRQIGQYEFMYCMENRGWLLLRREAHPGTMERLSRPGDGYFSVKFVSTTAPGIWFCPNSYDRPTGRLLSDEARRDLVALHRGGYAMFSAYWHLDLQRVMTNGEPRLGPISRRINMKAARINQLKSDMVRATEWWEPLPAFGGTGGPGAEATPPHADRSGRMAGGNHLCADGSVHWSSHLMEFYGGHLYVLAMPEQGSAHPAP